MLRKKKTATSIAITGVIAAGALATPVFAPAPPAQAIDSVWSLCAGLNPGPTKDDCFADQIEGTRASTAELACYRSAGLAIAGSIAGTAITTKDARIIAASAGVAGVFACIGTFVE